MPLTPFCIGRPNQTVDQHIRLKDELMESWELIDYDLLMMPSSFIQTENIGPLIQTVNGTQMIIKRDFSLFYNSWVSEI